LTYDNQGTLSSFSLFLSFVTNSPVAEKALYCSTDVGLIVIKAWHSFSRLFDLFLIASKRPISLSQLVIGSLPVPEYFCNLYSQGLRGFCGLSA